jgi:hypothetical protein
MITNLFGMMPIGDWFGIDDDGKKKHGIDKLQLMAKLMPILEGQKVKSNYNKLKSYLVSQLKRGITPREEENLCQAIVDYVQSDAASNERIRAMDNLFNLKFIA